MPSAQVRRSVVRRARRAEGCTSCLNRRHARHCAKEPAISPRSSSRCSANCSRNRSAPAAPSSRSVPSRWSSVSTTTGPDGGGRVRRTAAAGARADARPVAGGVRPREHPRTTGLRPSDTAVHHHYLLTLMGAYSFFSNDQVTVHLDAWHRLALGWCEPKRVQLTAHGSALVREISAERPDGGHPPASEPRRLGVLPRRRCPHLAHRPVPPTHAPRLPRPHPGLQRRMAYGHADTPSRLDRRQCRR